MAWMKVESSVARNRKFVKAGPAAAWLWICGLAYCQEGLTDGFIPTEALGYLGVKHPRPLVQQLHAALLWDAAPGGWQVHDYLTHNKPAAEVRRIIQERRNGGKLGGRPNLQGKPSEHEEVNIQGTLQGTLTENPALLCSAQIGSALLRSDQQQSLSAEPSNGSSPSVLTFPTVGPSSTWGLSSAQLAEWQALFPNIHVWTEMQKVCAWLPANPTKRKTAKGMPRFLVAWLTRAVDGANGNGHSSTRQPVARQAAQEPVHEPWTCPHVEDHASQWRCEQATALHRPRKADTA